MEKLKNYFLNPAEVLMIDPKAEKRMNDFAPDMAIQEIQYGAYTLMNTLVADGFTPDEVLGYILRLSINSNTEC